MKRGKGLLYQSIGIMLAVKENVTYLGNPKVWKCLGIVWVGGRGGR